MEIQRTRSNADRSVTLAVNGTVNTSNYTIFEEALNSELSSNSGASEPAVVILELSNARYITSLGLKALVSAQKKANRLHKKLIICGAGPYIMEAFETTGFISLFTIV